MYNLPIDVNAYKSKNTRLLMMNTHRMNFLRGHLIVSSAFLATALATGNSPLALVAFLNPIIGAVMLRRQFYALDFFAMGPDSDKFYDDANGLPIVAIEDGTVFDMKSMFPDEGSEIVKAGNPYGNFVIIEHKNKEFYSMYAHMMRNSCRLKIGQRVRKGQVIGKIGHSGNSDPNQSHLHFEMFVKHHALSDMPIRPTGFKSYTAAPLELTSLLSEKPLKEALANAKLISVSNGELLDCAFLTKPIRVPAVESVQYQDPMDLSFLHTVQEEKEGTGDPASSPEGGVEGGGLETKKMTREVTKRQHMREGKRAGQMPTIISYNFKNDVSK
jgi:hypothetical protein